MVREGSTCRGTKYEIDEINEERVGRRGIISYLSLNSFFVGRFYRYESLEACYLSGR